MFDKRIHPDSNDATKIGGVVVFGLLYVMMVLSTIHGFLTVEEYPQTSLGETIAFISVVATGGLLVLFVITGLPVLLAWVGRRIASLYNRIVAWTDRGNH